MVASEAMPATTRRSQEERRAETRGKLLGATLQSLADVGYAATTTRHVAELAGVSQGAQTHHFPRRVDLVAAALENLAEQRIAALGEAEGGLPPDPRERAAAVLDLLWADFSSPLFTVFVKAWVAAADDPELYAHLVPIERVLARAVAEHVELLRAERLRPPGLEDRVFLVLSTLRGLALSERFEPRSRRPRDRWPELRDLLVDALAGPRD
jgi:AcrR family transcriptional regulator